MCYNILPNEARVGKPLPYAFIIMVIDEFSWFVGLYEGEGCCGSRICKKTVKDTTYLNGGIYLTIKMTDEDTIARAAKFLGVSYKKITNRSPLSKKQAYMVRVMGGKKGKLYDLFQRMLPYLSKRRQEQVGYHINRALEYGDAKL